MRICHFEDTRSDVLEPLSLTRPVFDLVCGCTSLADKQRRFFSSAAAAVLVRPYLADFYRRQQPQLIVNDPAWLRAEPTVLVNGRWLPGAPMAVTLDEPHVGMIADEVAYVVVEPQHLTSCLLTNIEGCLQTWKESLPHRSAPGKLIRFAWDLVQYNGEQLAADFPVVRAAIPPALHGDWTVLGPQEQLHIAATAQVEPYVVFDTTSGPIAVAEEAVITAFSRIQGPCYIGPRTQVMGAKVRSGTTLGPQCRIGGEVEASIMHGYSNKYHEGFLGHSYVGEWVNLGAGTHNSDLRNDYGEVQVPLHQTPTATGMNKVGCFIGDHTKTGLATLINTGSNIGIFANILPAGMLAPKYVPSFATLWKGDLREMADLDRVFATAATVMQRRGCTLTEAHVSLYRHLYELTAFDRRRAIQEAKPGRKYRTA